VEGKKSAGRAGKKCLAKNARQFFCQGQGRAHKGLANEKGTKTRAGQRKGQGQGFPIDCKGKGLANGIWEKGQGLAIGERAGQKGRALKRSGKGRAGLTRAGLDVGKGRATKSP